MHVNVAIIGLNRISASMGLALKRYQARPKAEHTFTIMGNDAIGQTMKDAEKIGAVDNFHRSISKAVQGANLIIINSPLGKLEDLYATLGPELAAGVVVLDMTPHKMPVIEWANQHFPTNSEGDKVAYVVGITPIVNVNGLYNANFDAAAASADLFDDAEFLITPDTKCPSEAITLAEDVIKLIGGRTRFMDPAEHDGLIAATEALPALLGVSTFYSLQQSEGWPELRRMVNPTLALMIQHFRHQNSQDMFTLLNNNRANLARHLDALIGTLDQVRAALHDDAGTEQIEALLSVAYSEWEKWDVKRYSGKWEESKAPEIRGGLMGGFLGFGGLRRNKDEDED
ncbi:MAG: prephenate dehydrogenase/arogenate dehydrogenase family protein [Anaerolineae bacterium]|nr:prephenate dehydrogenase/arogenate dehydrogenase family protein [Anaerolineae bacterium]